VANGQFGAALLDRRRRRNWRRRAVAGAVLLSCLSAAAAQAVSAPPATTPLASGPNASGSAPIDTSSLIPEQPPSVDHPSGLPEVGPDAHAARGPDGNTVIHENTRERIASVSGTSSYDIPEAALLAYKRAVVVMDQTQPHCNVTWPVLAGIGEVESDQGRYGGARVLSDGTTDPHILGIPLNGVGNVARIPDTDNGVWDSDTVWDRAVGPMQFIPSTWRVVGVDADSDGSRDPNDFDDAALAAAVYLCANNRDLSTADGLHDAVYSYNHSEAYVATVLELARGYANGDVTVVPSDGPPLPGSGVGGTPPPGHLPDVPDTGGPGAPPLPAPGGGSPAEPGPGPRPDPGPTPGDPGPTPDPGSETIALIGFVAPCQKDTSAWCLSDAQLDFGANADLTQPQQDYDGDDAVEPVAGELSGLAGKRTRVLIDESHLVVSIRGLPYEYIEATTPADPGPTTPGPTDPGPTDPGPTDPGPTDPGPTNPGPTDPPSPTGQTATGQQSPSTEPDTAPTSSSGPSSDGTVSSTDPESTSTDPTPTAGP
jgi:membrane-bound lytic murein transglycosylase B